MVIDKRLGLSLDLVTGRVVCASCGMDTLALIRAVVLPHPLRPETVIAGMRCRCGAEQAVTLEQQDGAVIIGTTMPRA